MRRFLPIVVLALLGICPAYAQAPRLAAPTDLDAFMARALQRRDVDRQTISDYILDEVETFEVLGPGRIPFERMRREYTWYVRDGIHVRSPVKFDGVPIPEADRRAYEDRWIKSEEGRRKFRTERDAKLAQQGKPPAVSVPAVNEPRFVSESYFMDFKFEPGNYYLAGHELVDGHDVLKIDYVPTRLFDDSNEPREDSPDKKDTKDDKTAKGNAGQGQDKKNAKDAPAKPQKPPTAKEKAQQDKEDKYEQDINRKMNKTAQVTLWVDPVSHQIVKYTFDNIWMDFLPGAWLVRVDDLRASMEMGQPFPGVWLPRNLSIHAGLTAAIGSMELVYHREFSNYRKADVTTKIKIPKEVRQ